MTLDGITLNALVGELQILCGSKIEKIHQPERDEIVLLLHTMQGKKRLVLSANGAECRVHITSAQKPNPDKAPNFCMLLRKYISGGRITAISQVGLERIVNIDITARDEIGVECAMRLVVEIMGKYSNIILTRDEKVVDSIHRVPLDMSSVRQVLPGITYALPPMEKYDPRELSERSLADVVKHGRLMQTLQGICKASEQEIFMRRFGTERMGMLSEDQSIRLAAGVKEFLEDMLEKKRPCIQLENGMPYFYSAAPYIMQPEENRKYFDTMNEAVDAFYTMQQEARLLESRRNNVRKQLKKHVTRIGKKLAMQTDALAGKDRCEKLRIYGELVSANLYQIPRGAKEARVYNYYTNEEIVIPLNSAVSPSANAEAYFKKANKLKTAAALAKERYEEFSQELEYLESLDYTLEAAESLQDVEEVRLDMMKYGYLAQPADKKKVRRADPLESPMHFVTSDGFQVFAGRNNRQNDALTFRAADSEDLWFHAKNAPGSHVILFLEGKEPTDTAIEECAKIAAEHSKSRGAKAEVDYTKVKNVWKANGAKPGMVLFKAQHTIVVDT